MRAKPAASVVEYAHKTPAASVVEYAQDSRRIPDYVPNPLLCSLPDLFTIDKTSFYERRIHTKRKIVNL